MSAVAGSVGFTLAALIACCLFICWWQEAARSDELTDELGKMRRDFTALCDHLGVDVNSDDAPADWAEQDTDEFPAATEPMTAVPARVEDVPLAKVSAEIERDRRVIDVSAAHSAALLEDRIYEFRKVQAARQAMGRAG